ncbi:MAG: hypothetical protein GY780_01025 [bacterium]|nr:hypothetical protein [bacterium]
MKFNRRLFGPFLVALLFTVAIANSSPAQINGQAPADETQVDKPPRISQAGPYAKGSKHVSLVGGMGSSYGETYAIIGGGISYYLADGLSVGFSGEGWFLADPTIWKIAPDIRYTVWQMDRFKPYVGAFYRRTFMGNDYNDYNSWGGRAGVAYRQGGTYLSLGMVYEEYLNCNDTFLDCSTTYPEIGVWFAF